jgi:hypothetical protein
MAMGARCGIGANEGPVPFMYVSEERAEALRAGIARKAPELESLAKELRDDAEEELTRGPWSVTAHKSRAASGDPHDYYSEGPYWWPDPKNPDGPYMNRDGEVNPERFDAHGRAMGGMRSAVCDLSLAAFYLGEPRYARRAGEVLRVWFVDEATRMNPHLEYGQAIHGRTEGRGIGIIDTVSLIGLAHGLSHLSRSEGCDHAVLEAVRAWFADYLEWLCTSKKGLDERNTTNNHATYWAAQVGAYARLVGDEERAASVDEQYRTVLVPKQIEPDGSCPREEGRTKSLSYSYYNANAFAFICELAHHRGVDLWHFKTEDGRGIAAVVSYLAPYIADPGTWGKKQIKQVRPSKQLFLQLAGVRLGRQDYTDLNNSLEGGSSNLGPSALLAGGVAVG